MPSRISDTDCAHSCASRSLAARVPCKTTLAMLISLAMCGAVIATATHAPLAHAQSAAQQHSFQVAAGPLEDALNQFARQAGITLSFDPAAVSGKRVTALNGSYTVGQGFAILLADSGLQAVRNANGAYGLLNASQSALPQGTQEPSETTLPLVNVSADVEGSYAASQVSFGKGQSLRETPQSVSVITRQRIEDQNLNSMTDVLEQMTGMTLQTGSMGTMNFFSRGFEVDAFQFDGGASVGKLAPGFVPSGLNDLDMAQYDHVEVLRGADGLFTGAGNPGGVINLVRKRALAEQQVKFTASAGRWNNYRTELDVTGPLSLDGKVRGRAVVSLQDRDYFYDTAKSKGHSLFAVLETDLSPDTLWTVGASYQHQKQTPDGLGLPRYASGDDIRLPRNTAYIADWGRVENDTLQVFTSLEHAFSKDWSLRLNAMHMERDQYNHTVWGSGAVDPQTGLGHRWGGTLMDYRSRTLSLDATLRGSFDLFGLTHDLRVGADYQKQDARVRYDTTFFGVFGQPIDLYAPVVPGKVERQAWNHSYDPLETRQSGIFGTLRLRFNESLSLIAGGRYANYRTDQQRAGAWGDAHIRYEDRNVFVPYGALVYELANDWSVYGSVSETYQSQATNLRGPLPGTPLDPVTGRNHELGLKGELWGGRLNTAFALYRTERKGQAVSDPDYPSTPGGMGSNCCWLDLGEQISEGVDVEVNGEVLPGWQIFAGYTYNSNKDKGQNTGRFSTITPRHLLKLFTTYQLPGEWSAWKIGGGVTAQSTQYVSGTSRAWNPATQKWDGASIPFNYTQGGYAVWNLNAEYRIDPRWSMSLAVNNLLDKTYYQTVGTNASGNWYGEPRNWMVTLRGRF